jgi:uncharacterized YceG family protein
MSAGPDGDGQHGPPPEPEFAEREFAEPEFAEPEVEEPFDAPLDHDAEAPSGIRRVARRAGGGGETPPGPRPVREPRGPRGHSRAGRIIAVLALILGLALLWFLNELFQPFHGSGHGSVTVTIPAHRSSSQVGDLLERDGIVSSSFFFELRATLAGERSSLRPGTYHLKRDMSYGDALKILTTPPPAAKVTDLTITEGKTRQQIDALLRSQGIRGNYLAASRRSPLLDRRQYQAPPGTPSLEGFLFPSTYQLTEPISAEALVADQLKTFKQKFATVNLAYARSKGLTPYQVLIVASMVEAEASKARDRPLVASVIYNRLRLGMLLQIDAAVRYAVNNYTKPITVSQLHSPSPWNTYVHKGLPPTPIDNPGMASIQAAAHPATSNYIFFVVKVCGNGEEVFSSTLTQFQADQQRYQSARAQRGGKSPAHC